MLKKLKLKYNLCTEKLFFLAFVSIWFFFALSYCFLISLVFYFSFSVLFWWRSNKRRKVINCIYVFLSSGERSTLENIKTYCFLQKRNVYVDFFLFKGKYYSLVMIFLNTLNKTLNLKGRKKPTDDSSGTKCYG